MLYGSPSGGPRCSIRKGLKDDIVSYTLVKLGNDHTPRINRAEGSRPTDYDDLLPCALDLKFLRAICEVTVGDYPGPIYS